MSLMDKIIMHPSMVITREELMRWHIEARDMERTIEYLRMCLERAQNKTPDQLKADIVTLPRKEWEAKVRSEDNMNEMMWRVLDKLAKYEKKSAHTILIEETKALKAERASSKTNDH